MLIWKTGIYDTEYGALNFIIKSLGGKPIDFLGSTAYAKWSVLLMGFPFVGGYLIFYGGVMNIPSSYYEAAELEGIGIWKRLFYIDIPLIVPQLKYVVYPLFAEFRKGIYHDERLSRNLYAYRNNVSEYA